MEQAIPHPEEMNRQLTGVLADLHFAPTSKSAANLLHEGKREDCIYITGNTAIDALRTTVKEGYSHPILNRLGNNRFIFNDGTPP
ncbi:hypothetical protein GCM10020331_024290 [Ectobacillus funiculus]